MKQSKAYKDFKERTQEIFNFAVLVTLSVPVLKQNIKLFSDKKIKRLPDPDYFEPSVVYEISQDTIDTLIEKGLELEKAEKLKSLIDLPLNSSEFKIKVIDAIGETDYKANRNEIKRQSKNYAENITNCTTNYQAKLASYLYFSTFSYFEAFIMDIAIEMTKSIRPFDREKYVNEFLQNQDIISDMVKLDKEFDPRKINRYKKFSTKLQTQGYRDSEELIFASLLDIYNNKIENLKANEIPVFLEKTLMFKMTDDESNTFHVIRGNRNTIGHGAKHFNPNLNDVIKANKFFKSLSDRIDKHVTYYFFKLKNYKGE
ncbi:MAG: hypothetical protein IPP32_14220 [Bacteroidetes bacterium]|nr:hypothetical protein [Bacteroidota bacterium]